MRNVFSFTQISSYTVPEHFLPKTIAAEHVSISNREMYKLSNW